MATRRVSPSVKKNAPSRGLRLFEEGVGIIVASLVMIIAAPVFVHAFADNVAQAQTTDTSPILSAIAQIKTQLDALSMKVDALSTGADATVTAPGMGQCLSVCRSKEAICLKTALKAPLTFSAGSVNSASSTPLVSSADTACRKSGEGCELACKPQTTTSVSCEARCAVDLGACIRAAGDDTALAARCRVRNQVCLADLCASSGGGSLLLRASRVPPASCDAQCDLESRICGQTSKEDSNAQLDCDNVTNICHTVVCAGTPPPIGTTLLDLCENSCTATFNSCSATAAKQTDPTTAQNSCNTRYGSCRDNCRKVAGGTTESFGASSTKTGIAPPKVTRPTFRTFPSDVTVSAGTPVSISLVVDDPDPKSFITLSSTGLPAGAATPFISSNPATFAFTWTPTASDAGKSAKVCFTASDTAGLQTAGSSCVNITVTPQAASATKPL